MTSPYYQYGLELAGGGEPFFYVGTNTAFSVRVWVAVYRSASGVISQSCSTGSQAQFYVNGILVRTQPLAASIQARGNRLNIRSGYRTIAVPQGLLDESADLQSGADLLRDPNGHDNRTANTILSNWR